MMDPKKIWVCNKGHRYTDFNRAYGEIECPRCAYDEAVKRMQQNKEKECKQDGR